MARNDGLTKVLALVGTGLVWLPLLAPVVFGVLSLVGGRGFRFDYLMPAELFLVALAGGGLLLWAALRRRSHARLIGGSLGLAVILLVGSQALAVVTGLASGATTPDGWEWVAVLALLGAYTLALVGLGVSGGLLVSGLFRARPAR